MDTKMPSQKTAINNWYKWLTLDQRVSNWAMDESGTVADIIIVISIIVIVAIVTVIVAVVIVFDDTMIAAYGWDTSQLLII